MEAELPDSRQKRAHGEGAFDKQDGLSFDIPAEAGARCVIVTDTRDRIRFTDSRISELLGVAPSEIIGKDIGEAARGILKHRFANPDGFEQRYRWLRDHPTESAEDVLELVSPKKRILHRYTSVLLDERHQPMGRIEVYSDITKRRALEEANADLYGQVRAAFDELRSTQDQLLQSEKLRAVGEIASGVAHDFNNILAIILGNIQLLLHGASDERTCARLQAIERAALDGAETVRRIREFTKVHPDEPLSTVDLSDLVAGVVGVMEPSWQNSMQVRGCRIDVDLDLADDVHAFGVAPEIREVLANVLLNAVQAMSEGGNIHVSTGRTDSSVWVKVTDTGIGMTEEVRSRAFEPFFTTRGVEGTGLGLSVAYGIVERHNGGVTIDSTPGKGTTVVITLPAAERSMQDAVSPTRSIEKPLAARILVVEDEEMFARVFVDMLSEQGHTVCVARSGPDAIEQFKAKPFDLVFTDLGMPEMSGWQVAQSIKELEPRTPVVLLTGWGAKVDDEKLAEAKIDMVIPKPVQMDELSGIISRALAKDAVKSGDLGAGVSDVH